MPIYSDVEQVNTKLKSKAEDLATVYQSIANILNTTKTERFFNPEFGSELEDILFEPMDSITETKIFRLVVQAIERWEPRVSIDYGKSSVVGDPDDHQYDVSLVFKVKGIDNENLTFSGLLLQSN
jgi:phage baseplate assembly protein W